MTVASEVFHAVDAQVASDSHAAAGAVPASADADAADGAKSTSEHKEALTSSVIVAKSASEIFHSVTVAKSASEIFHAVDPQVVPNVHGSTGAEQAGGTSVAGDAHPDATLAIYDYICGKRA